MAVYYQFEKIISGICGGIGRDPNITSLKNISREKAFSLLMQAGKMKGQYLGACLDSCRWGSMTTCCWPTDIHGLMAFIQKWRDENNDNESLYHEMPIEQVYKKFELPRISYDKCPRDENHKETFEDSAGRIRCGHRTVLEMKLSFIETLFPSSVDELSQTRYTPIYENEPKEPHHFDDDTEEEYCDDEEYNFYLKEMERYEAEEPVQVLDVCYSIIKEPENMPLAFETLLRRLNIQPETKTVYCGSRSEFSRCRRLDELDETDRRLAENTEHCPGHEERNNQVEFTFDGWTLAYYLLRWKQQGNAPWNAEKKEVWRPREYLRVCSED